MFFLKMISRSFSRQFKRRLLIAVTVCLSATVSVAMLGVVFDVGDKLNAELSTYGSNIVVQPKSDAVVSDLYNTGDSAGSASGSSSGSDGGSTSDGSAAADSADPTAFLKESDAQKIKTIFWAFNITNFAPELNIHADAGCVGSGLVRLALLERLVRQVRLLPRRNARRPTCRSWARGSRKPCTWTPASPPWPA